MLTCHQYIFYSEVFVQVFCPFLNRLFVFLLLSFKSSLYILESSPLSEVSFANIFFWLVSYLLILLTVSFREQKFLTLMKCRLSVISVINQIFNVISKKSSLYTKSLGFLLWHCLGVFNSFILYIQDYAPFWLNFWKGCEVCIQANFVLHVSVRLFQHHLSKRLYLLHCNALLLCQRQLAIFMWVFFWAVYSMPLIYLLSLSPVSHCLEYCSFIGNLEII